MHIPRKGVRAQLRDAFQQDWDVWPAVPRLECAVRHSSDCTCRGHCVACFGQFCVHASTYSSTIVGVLLIRTAAVVHLRAHTHARTSQFTSLFGARLSEKMEVALHSPWLRLPRMLSILADRGFRHCQRFYERYNKCVFTCLCFLHVYMLVAA